MESHWGLYRNRLQKPENGADKAMQPPKNRLQKKEKHHTSYEVQCFFGGEYRDRTGDLLHAMQALSRTTLKHTPRRACVNGCDLALMRQIRLKSGFLSNKQHSSMRTIRHRIHLAVFYSRIFLLSRCFMSFMPLKQVNILLLQIT